MCGDVILWFIKLRVSFYVNRRVHAHREICRALNSQINNPPDKFPSNDFVCRYHGKKNTGSDGNLVDLETKVLQIGNQPVWAKIHDTGVGLL